MVAPVTTDSIWQALEGQTFAVLSWVTPRGTARSAGIIFIARGRKLFIGAEGTSWKVRHIRKNPGVSITATQARRIVFMPWLKLPDATITFHGSARIIEHDDIDPDILHELEEGMADDPERVANTCLIEITPEGDFVTYGIGVSVMAMQDPNLAMGRAPVA